MISAPLTSPAYACSPDANRVGPDASARLPGWCACFIAAVIRFIFAHMFGDGRRSRVPSWWHDRPDLPPGSAMALAASIRGEFGTAIAWMCRRRGIGPGHPDWPYLARTIVAFGGSIKGARPGLPACGLQWWENPNVIPGLAGEPVATPAADAMASLLSHQAMAAAPSPASEAAPEAVPAAARLIPFPAPWRSASAPTAAWRRSSTGPPIGPPTGPPTWAPCDRSSDILAPDERGQPMAGPAVLIRAAWISLARPGLPPPAAAQPPAR